MIMDKCPVCGAPQYVDENGVPWQAWECGATLDGYLKCPVPKFREQFPELTDVLPHDVVCRIARLWLRGYVINIHDEIPETLKVHSGNQSFGSGGFRADWWVLYGEIEELNSQNTSTSFINRTTTTLRITQTPRVIAQIYGDLLSGISRWVDVFFSKEM